MQEVRYILDKCLKNNEPNLIDKIIDTIDDNVDKCKQCGYIDSVDIFNKCNICRRKDKVIKHYNNLMQTFYYLECRLYGHHCDDFSDNLNDYIKNIVHIWLVDPEPNSISQIKDMFA